jgi:hypothetical protein
MSTRHPVSVVVLSFLALLGGTAIWYWYTHIHIQQPALHAVRCEWRGNQVRISGVAYNPNGTAHVIGVLPTYQLANNRFIQNRHLEVGPVGAVPAHGSARWSYQSPPAAGVWHSGQRFAACNPTAAIGTGDD